MRIINVNGDDGALFNAVPMNVLRQFWRNTRSFQCIGNPKQQNLLLYLSGCRITYTCKDGRVLVAESGDLVYTPEGSEYQAKLSDFVSAESHTVGINFTLLDACGERAVLSDKIEIFHAEEKSELHSLIHRAERNQESGTALQGKIILLNILSKLMTESRTDTDPIIAEAIKFLAEHIEENPSISALAERCNVSEVYLRRKFKQATGTSPAKYRNTLRLGKAASYLKFGDISVQEISDTLGYSTVSHFIKEFKETYGLSPLQYRKRGDA